MKQQTLGYRLYYGLPVGLKRPVVVALAMVMLAAGLAGCSFNRTLSPDSYVVQRGDTLSGIGAEYGIDWHKLARWNHIAPPYRLHVGQKLSLRPFPEIDYSQVGRTRHEPAAQNPAPAQHTGQTQPLPQAPPPAVTRTPDAPEQAANNDSRDASAPATKPQHGGAEKTSAEEQSIGSVAAAVDTQQTPVEAAGPETDGWHWPTTGKLLRSYNPSSRHQGIEIGGKKGAAVHAASSGKVVYNGSGLKGYGRLIIIKHNQHYLSAYGFLQQSLVKEGQTVQADAHIADMGLGPGNKPMLLFEIRRDGDPIDPQKVLPKR